MLAIIYGSTTGNTADVAEQVKTTLASDDIELFDVKDISMEIIDAFDKIIFAIPTWDYGEIQEDWDEVWDEVDQFDFTGKTVAFIGLGDQLGYAEWFLDAMGLLHDKVIAKGGKAVGYWSVDGYEFDDSKALTEDKQFFVGLALDEDTQREMSEARIIQWCDQVRSDLIEE